MDSSFLKKLPRDEQSNRGPATPQRVAGLMMDATGRD
jgi:hypothetical protein